MCTAVDGGSIHRTAKSINAASDQRSSTLMAHHRTTDRRRPLRSVILECASGFSVTFQNSLMPRSRLFQALAFHWLVLEPRI